jgi:hypothetical protein
MTTIIEILLNNGQTVSGRADFGKGSPANPMSDEDLVNKFHQCASWGRLPRINAEMIVEWVFNLEKLPRIRELTRWLASDSKQPRATRSKPASRLSKLH